MNGESMGSMDGAYDRTVAEEALRQLAGRPLTATDKGFAGIRSGSSATPVGLVAAGAQTDDGAFSTPSLLLRRSAVEHNIRTLADYCDRRGVLLAPHAKTTMSPELFVAQLDAGAWALTVANVTQARVCVRYGARRILIANEVTDATSLRSLVELLREQSDLEVYCYVDSTDAVALIDSAFDGRAAVPRLLVEVGLPGGRTGVRTVAAAVEVARVAAESRLGRVCGVSCFEGVLGHLPAEEVLPATVAFCSFVRGIGEQLVQLGLVAEGGLILSAGGSHYFDVVADQFSGTSVPDSRVVVRSGSYVVHDHGTYLYDTPSVRGADLRPFEPAISIRTSVLSHPEPDLVLINAGRRDVSFDSGLPVVLSAERRGEPVDVSGAIVTDLNDQHGFLRVPSASALAAGDTVLLGISHPCTTFDKWAHALLTDDDGRVTGVAHTSF